MKCIVAQLTRNSAETVHFHKISTQGKSVKFRYFAQCFSNQASISEWNLDFQIELRFQNQASIFKSNFNFKMEFRSRNRALILKSSYDFKIELTFQNRVSISKSSFNFLISRLYFDFKIKLQFQIFYFQQRLFT